jgi:polyphosphate kinase
MGKQKLNAPELYINRELSWLEFNDRVLRQGLSEKLPLMERLKFLAIVASNLDEFFMVRVAGLMQQRSAGVRKRDVAGMTPAAQLTAISSRAHRMIQEQSQGIRAALNELADHGLRVFDQHQWDDSQRRFLRSFFTNGIQPVLTPLALGKLNPPPLLPGLQLFVGALISGNPVDDQAGEAEAATDEPPPQQQVVVVPVPSQFSRFITLPADEGVHIARLEDVIADNLASVFPGCDVLCTTVLRVTRDGDVSIADDDASDLLQVVEDAVITRRRRAAVRLEISADTDRRLKRWFTDWLELQGEDVYDIPGMLDATALWEIVGRRGFESLKIPDWQPQPPQDLLGESDLWEAIEDHDILLSHPYESFEPVVQLLEEAAGDPNVLAIKQTLYRTSGDSPIIQALERAAENGKEVTVLVELKARFDEARNVGWARKLEDAGCHVIYGVVGLKTHGKALLVVRRQSQRIRRYVHLSTGNYNDKTARLYADIGMFTCDRQLAGDVAAFFNVLTGYSEMVGMSKIAVAPPGLRQRFIDLIEREIRASTPDRPGLIMAKVNSLQDPDICRALFEASQAGVKIMLNIRGICCLRPGMPGVSETIEVRSIIDRYLEHARIFYFRNGGHEEVYLSSADWMRRNLSKRLEMLFPVSDPRLRRRLIAMLDTCFADNQQSYRLLPEGTYEPVPCEGEPIRAQEVFYRQAVEAIRQQEQQQPQFQPLSRPREK